jgi:nitrogen regulatory protein PII
MKRIKAVIARSSLDDFHHCLRQLGIFGFDLSEKRARSRDSHQGAHENSARTKSRIEVDFAVLDEEAKPTVHAVLESAHPDSVGIFKFEQEPRRATQPRSA